MFRRGFAFFSFLSFPIACRLMFPFVLVIFFARPFFFSSMGLTGVELLVLFLSCQHWMFVGAAAADLGVLDRWRDTEALADGFYQVY